MEEEAVFTCAVVGKGRSALEDEYGPDDAEHHGAAGARSRMPTPEFSSAGADGMAEAERPSRMRCDALEALLDLMHAVDGDSATVPSQATNGDKPVSGQRHEPLLNPQGAQQTVGCFDVGGWPQHGGEPLISAGMSALDLISLDPPRSALGQPLRYSEPGFRSEVDGVFFSTYQSMPTANAEEPVSI